MEWYFFGGELVIPCRWRPTHSQSQTMQAYSTSVSDGPLRAQVMPRVDGAPQCQRTFRDLRIIPWFHLNILHRLHIDPSDALNLGTHTVVTCKTGLARLQSGSFISISYPLGPCLCRSVTMPDE